MPEERLPRKPGRQHAEELLSKPHRHGLDREVIAPGALGALGRRKEKMLVDGPSGGFPPPLALLLKTAQQEIDWHVNDHGLCAVCGSAFPCERAKLADLALSGL